MLKKNPGMQDRTAVEKDAAIASGRRGTILSAGFFFCAGRELARNEKRKSGWSADDVSCYEAQKWEIRECEKKLQEGKTEMSKRKDKGRDKLVDEGLRGNERIEDAIAALQEEVSQEMLAHTLTVIRRRMREGGQVILAVEMPQGDEQIKVQTITTADGGVWWAAFTSFNEELKGGGSVKSTFLTDLDQLFETALTAQGIRGVIINPWNRTIMLDKTLIQIVLGNQQEEKRPEAEKEKETEADRSEGESGPKPEESGENNGNSGNSGKNEAAEHETK